MIKRLKLCVKVLIHEYSKLGTNIPISHWNKMN
jgi:hypothetical protein